MIKVDGQNYCESVQIERANQARAHPWTKKREKESGYTMKIDTKWLIQPFKFHIKKLVYTQMKDYVKIMTQSAIELEI